MSFNSPRPVRRSPRLTVSSTSCSSAPSGIDSCSLRVYTRRSGNSEVKNPEKKQKISSKQVPTGSDPACFLVGDPIPMEEARQRWPFRYAEQGKKVERSSMDDDEDLVIVGVKCHYAQASIVGTIFKLGDCAYVKGEDGKSNYLGKIIEFFETVEGEYYFRVRWFFRAEDTVMKEEAACHNKKRVFYSNLCNDNLLECIVSKIKIIQITPNIDMKLRAKVISSCDFYFDMSYCVDYSTFGTMMKVNSEESSEGSSNSIEKIYPCAEGSMSSSLAVPPRCKSEQLILSLLDLYSGCGAMSTGLCIGAKLASVNLVARWAVDFNEAACESLKLNHPETQVRNEQAEYFFQLLKEWEKLCKRYDTSVDNMPVSRSRVSRVDTRTSCADDSGIPSGEYEVSSLVGICYGDPCNLGKTGLRFKVRWKGYDESEDTWELIEALSNCQEKIRDFVREGLKSKILPLPGDVDVVCGGPPCQGISGYNRHRNVDAPLDDEKNHQLVVFMDIVKFLRPKYVLMENVVDILKFNKGSLGRYALSRLVQMNYQARLGIMAAGCYGLPQFRLRAFFWGAHPSEKLPPYPLPTHDVILRGSIPSEFVRNAVAYEEGQIRNLEKALTLVDAISDLPVVTYAENRDEAHYDMAPQNEFQRYVRSTKYDMLGSSTVGMKRRKAAYLYDHLPLKLSNDNHLRLCRIPKRKGANFRDLPGIIVENDNTVHWDSNMKRELLPSGKPLIPDYVVKFEEGKSSKPFGRLWWDETVPTVVTQADPYTRKTIHPDQDRVLTVRETARLQGFPDFYKLCGTVRQRYHQVGNAVAVPVARALGYAMGMAWLRLTDDQPIITLPPNFAYTTLQHPPSSSD